MLPRLRAVCHHQDGWGCVPNYRLSLELFRKAADLGDPEAQGQMGLRYALGLHQQSAWDAHGIHQFGEVCTYMYVWDI